LKEGNRKWQEDTGNLAWHVSCDLRAYERDAKGRIFLLRERNELRYQFIDAEKKAYPISSDM